MVIKVKEITIGRSRKWAWDFGNSVGFNVSITIEGTNAKDTLEDMSKAGIVALLPLQEKEQERCRDVYDIGQLQEGIEFKEAVEVAQQSTSSGHPVEKLEIKKLPKNTKKAPANGKYKVSTKLCNKCQGYISWDGWSQGALPTHVDGEGNILGNGDCPNGS